MVQLPAVNTPQFDWVLSRLPDKAQPVPPIYQPELIARAVLHMADYPRREMWLTERTVLAIVGNRLFPATSTGSLAGAALPRSRRTRRPTPSVPPICGSRSREITAPTAPSTPRSTGAAVWASIHRQALTIAGLGSLGVAATIGGARRIAR